MLRVQRRHGIFIFVTFVIIVWQCYYIEWTPSFIHRLPESVRNIQWRRPATFLQDLYPTKPPVSLPDGDDDINSDEWTTVSSTVSSPADEVTDEVLPPPEQSSPATSTGSAANGGTSRKPEHYEVMIGYARNALPTHRSGEEKRHQEGEEAREGQEVSEQKKEEITYKRILFWNEAYGNKNYGVGLGRDALERAGCPVYQCETSDDQNGAEDYDAVLFHLRSWTPDSAPRKRSPNQRYVFWSIESAAWRYVDTRPMAGFFNWTMTYRWDSDIVNSYGWIAPLANNTRVALHPSAEQLERFKSDTRSESAVNYAAGKTKFAAWFVSNCNSLSGRNEFVAQLKKYVDVDVYGGCGTMSCPRKDEEECRRMAANKYKFYLSLENSLCLDYITEKFYGMMHHPILPIVVDVHGSHRISAPTHSFVNAAEFRSAKELAGYLDVLDKNDTLYNEYFWWKGHFEVRNSEYDYRRGMCQLCAALHDDSRPPKVYHDMTRWWDNESQCKTIKYQ